MFHVKDKSTFGLKNCNCSFHVHAKLFNDNVTETLNEGDLGDASGILIHNARLMKLTYVISDEDHEIEGRQQKVLRILTSN